jgi:hypothetical protein
MTVLDYLCKQGDKCAAHVLTNLPYLATQGCNCIFTCCFCFHNLAHGSVQCDA